MFRHLKRNNNSIAWALGFSLMALVNIICYNIQVYDIITVRYFYVSIISLLLFFFALKNNDNIKWNKIDFYIGLILGYLFFHTLYKNFTIDNIGQILYPFIIYYSVRLVAGKSLKNVIPILIPYIILSLIESIIGILQYIGFVDGGDYFDVVGTFSNPTRLAGFLLITSPLIAILKCRVNKSFFHLLIILNLLAMILTNNRSAILGLIVSVLYYKTYYKSNVNMRRILLLILPLFFVVVLFFLHKPNSAIGRLFIWKICFQELYQYFFVGSGFNSFISIYNNAQGEYFSTSNPTAIELYNANFVAYPYNDFLMLIIEFGVPIFFMVICLFLKLIRKNNMNIPTLIYLKLSLVAISVYSMFSYVSKVPVLVELIMIIIALIVTIENNKSSHEIL